MNNLYKADLTKSTKENTYYSLAMFPYPSGAWLHVWHGSNFTANDIIARFKRMQWYTVINPIGWDSFGLPTENYAMKVEKPASVVTEENIAFYKTQCELMDWSYDWDREVATSNPSYYKWTQWIFQELYKAWLVYKKDAYVNRCPVDQTVLANDQVIDGRCERCNTEIIQKKHPQRFIKITEYAEKLIADLDLVDRPEETKSQQKYWIGKSEWAEIDFVVENVKITVFTTRPDTLFGVTALVLAPENTTIDAFITDAQRDAVEEYRKATSKKTNVERQKDAETKSWVFSGAYATHPLTQEKVPIRFADYVLMDYATGAVMFVPAHDERDFLFWKAHIKELPEPICVIDVGWHLVPDWEEIWYIQPWNFNKNAIRWDKLPWQLTAKYDIDDNDTYPQLYNSKEFNWLTISKSKKAITEHLEKQWLWKKKTTYKLRDWSVSRQRYWGSPIPVYYTFDDNEEVPFFMYTSGNKAFRPGLPIAPRRVIQCIVKDINSDQYCFIKRAHDNDVSLMMWGIDGDEDMIVAAKRELVEEAGLHDVTFIKHLGEFQVQFYHPTKNRNQYSTNQVLYFEADKSKQWKPTDDEAKSLHQAVWMKADEFLVMTHNDTSVFCMNWLLTGEHGIKHKTPRYHAYNPHPDKDKRVPHLIPTEELPVILPLDLGNYKPQGKSPLADHATFPYYVPGASQEKLPYFDYHDEIRGIREWVETKIRSIAQAVIVDPTTGKYLALKWKVDNAVSFVAGWIEEGENARECLIREIHEETWYTDVKYVKPLGHYQAHFYHPLKWHNQHSLGEVLYFELQSHQKDTLDKKELEKHEPLWMTKEEFLAMSNEPVNDYFIGVLEGKIPEHKTWVSSANRNIAQKVLLLHGWGNNSDDGSCLHGLQKALLQGGYAIEYNTYDYEKVKAERIYSNDTHASVVVGHSTWWYLALKYAQSHKVDALMLISPNVSTDYMPTYLKDMAAQDFKDAFETYKAFHQAPIDHDAVKKNAKRIIFVFGSQDKIIREEIMQHYKSIYGDRAEFVVLNQWHMWTALDYEPVPELGNLIIQPCSAGTYTYLRECDTLDTFMCSSFYYLRFVDPYNTQELISKELSEKALPVDFYIGGKEHTYGHLLYARFIHKFLFDKWYLTCPEPFQRLFHQGMILGPDGRKMSKRWGNVITPADLVNKYGLEMWADVLRTYTMFMWPLEVEKAWNDNAVEWVKKFLDRVVRMEEFISPSVWSKAEESRGWQWDPSTPLRSAHDDVEIQLHKAIKWVGDDIEKLKFNTAVSKMMVFVNFVYDKKSITKDQLSSFLQLLAPFATKLSQEMWTKLWREGSIHLSKRPAYDDSLLADDTLSLPVQILGKTRWTLDVKKWITQEEIMTLIAADEKLQKYIEGKEVKKIIYVQDKIVNIVV
jgi:leucyl-tRNA synthetase/8-oxo-dGTP pyrophosphatase MutT (NUDIX family)